MSRHRFQGDPARFEVLAEFVYQTYGREVNYVADVAGGRGALTRILRKRYNYEAEVVDPRGWALKGVPNRKEEFSAEMAGYYDLVIGLHADEATRAVAEAAATRPVILVPCCNFWDRSKKLGRDALLDEIQCFFQAHQICCKRVRFDFKGPMNIGLVTLPPQPSR
jgi:hypothetical protein